MTTSLAQEIAARKAADLTEANTRVNFDAALSARIAELEARVLKLEQPPVTPPVVTAARALGVYVHTSAYDFAKLDTYAALAGRKPAFAMTYQMFGTSGDGWQFPVAQLAAWSQRGITPVLSWQPFDWNRPQDAPLYSLTRFLAGDFDAYIGTWVTAAKAYGKPLWIRFAHEMNGDFYPWGRGVSGNTPQQYVAAFRRVVAMFRAGGATNVRWIWCPNVTGLSGQYPLTGLYPGDDVVDMVGMDGYNWSTSGQGEAGWATFTRVFGATYDALRLIAASKPIGVFETGCVEAGGDKAAWIRDAFTVEIPARFPALSALLWFDATGEFQQVWAVNTSVAASTAWRAVVAAPAWQGAFA